MTGRLQAISSGGPLQAVAGRNQPQCLELDLACDEENKPLGLFYLCDDTSGFIQTETEFEPS